MKRKENSNVNLDNIITLYNFYNSIKSTDKKIRKVFYRDMIGVATILGLSAVMITAYLIFKNHLIVIIPTSLFASYILIDRTKDFFKHRPKIVMKWDEAEKLNEEDIAKSKYFNYDFKKDLAKELIGLDGIDTITLGNAEEYHNDDFKSFKKQNQHTLRNQPTLKIANKKPEVLNKEESIEAVIQELEACKRVYKLPEITITNKQWDLLTDNIYDFLESANKEEKYYETLSFLLQYTLAKGLVKNKNISLRDFTESLEDIMLNHKKQNVKKLQKNLLKENDKKVINFDFVKRKQLTQ